MVRLNIFGRVDRFAYMMNLRYRQILANRRAQKKQRTELTAQEKILFEKTWKGCRPESAEFYKAFCGKFDEKYVPNDYYDYAEHVLNLRWAALFLQHKCCLKYIIPEENRPRTVLQKIDGHFVLEDNSEISFQEAKDILKKKGSFICKIAGYNLMVTSEKKSKL